MSIFPIALMVEGYFFLLSQIKKAPDQNDQEQFS